MSKVTPISRDVRLEPKTAQERTDGWQNFVTLLGTSSDKRTHAELHWEPRTPEFFEHMYSGGGIPARIVDLIPEEALRHWIEWVGVDKKVGEKLHTKCEELDVRGSLLKAWKWGRAFGGGVCHIVTDTSDPASPLSVGERVIGLRDLSRWDLRVLTTDVEFDFGSPNWGQPRIYYLNVQMGAQYKGYPIHWTRMLRFDGQLVPRRTYILNNYWHDSVLNRVYNAIRNYETANDSVASMLQDFNVDVFKMKNLANLISAGKEQIVKNRIETMNLVKSVINAMIIDTDQEDYENKSRSVEGLSDLLDRQSNRLVAETDLPHTKLLGESPDGSNATGNSTSQQWYNFIATEQENYLRPKLKRLLGVMFPELPDLDFKFKSLRVLDDLEKADMRLKVAQTDDIYLTHQVVDPTEVAMSRFGADEYSMDTKPDWDARNSGELIPGQQELEQEGTASGGQGENEEGQGQMTGKPMSTTGNKGEGNSDPSSSSGTGNGKPTETEPGQDMRGHEGEGKDITGVPTETHPPITGPHAKRAQKSDDDVDPNIEGSGVEGLFSSRKNPGTQFDFRNEHHEIPGSVPKTTSFISQTMSEPMRDPRTDPHIKGPGIPNKNPTYLPQRGNGQTAPSGFDFEKDAGKAGVNQYNPSRAVEGGSYYAYDSANAKTIIVRHGSTDLNGDEETDRIRGWKDVPLSEDGKKDAEKASKTVSKLDIPIKAVVSSGLSRTNDTAKAIANESGLKHVVDERLKPWNLGNFTGQLTKEVKDQIQEYAKPENENKPVPGGESFREFLDRYLSALKEYLSSDAPYVLVTHLRNVKATQAWLGNGAPDDFSVKSELMTPNGDFPGMVMAVNNDGSTECLNPGDKSHGPKKDSERVDYITHSGDKWIVHSESGKHLGEYGSKSEAEKRLRQIEYFKHRGDSERPRAATIIVRDGDKFLMGKRRDTGRWSLPGGMIEGKESAHQGGVRELAEETGLKANRMRFLGTRLVESEMGNPVEVTMYSHKHDGTKPVYKNDPDKEFDEFRWVSSKDKLPEEISGNLAHPNNIALQYLGLLR